MAGKKEFTTIDEYISTFPADIQAILEKMRQVIQKAAPEATETMSYGIPTFNLNGKHLVFFAGWKDHISLYPMIHTARSVITSSATCPGWHRLWTEAKLVELEPYRDFVEQIRQRIQRKESRNDTPPSS